MDLNLPNTSVVSLVQAVQQESKACLASYPGGEEWGGVAECVGRVEGEQCFMLNWNSGDSSICRVYTLKTYQQAYS